MTSSFFREPVMPSHAQDRLARERFLLDTYVERRASEKKGARSAFRGFMARALRPVAQTLRHSKTSPLAAQTVRPSGPCESPTFE